MIRIDGRHLSPTDVGDVARRGAPVAVSERALTRMRAPTDPQKLTSVLIGDSVSGMVASYLNDSLLTKDVNGELQPLLTEAVPTPSPDALTISFKLRSATWTDGTALTADDVVFTT
jgi:ABC-type transport system substrate-binding protein